MHKSNYCDIICSRIASSKTLSLLALLAAYFLGGSRLNIFIPSSRVKMAHEVVDSLIFNLLPLI